MFVVKKKISLQKVTSDRKKILLFFCEIGGKKVMESDDII